MSLRAIKKRESQFLSEQHSNNKQNLYKKSLNSSKYHQQQQYYNKVTNNNNKSNLKTTSTTISSLHILKQRHLLGRATNSAPELQRCYDSLQEFVIAARLLRRKSENDVTTLLKSCSNNQTTGAEFGADRGLVSAKSEICLQTITTRNYQEETTNTIEQNQSIGQIKSENEMLSHSHRDLRQSSYGANNDRNVSPIRRRLSECSLNSTYSQRTSVMSSSANTLYSQTASSMDANAVVRVPIIGYEVMEERARFTVYKLRVENPISNDCWLVLRRYTDFVRLNTKLKQAYPQISLMLPRKKIFGDNFNSVFLDNRVQGLQMFVNSIMAKEELRKCKMVREFFCLDEPPTYSESMEECRAIFEAQEETIAHLKLQINSKNDLILNLQQKLREEIIEKEQLKQTIKNLSCPSCAKDKSSSSFL